MLLSKQLSINLKGGKGIEMKKNSAAFSSVGGAERIASGLFSAKPLPILAVCGNKRCGRIKSGDGWTRWTTGACSAPKELCPECAKLLK